MAFRTASLVDSILELDERSREPDAIRMRRAALAKYAKAAIAGCLVIFVAAGMRLVASAVLGDEADGLASAASAMGEAPTRGKGVELLATAPQGAKLVSGVAVAKVRSRAR